jgi:hypothetical protein
MAGLIIFKILHKKMARVCWKNQSPTNKKLEFQGRIKRWLGRFIRNTHDRPTVCYSWWHTNKHQHMPQADEMVRVYWEGGNYLNLNTQMGQYCPIKSSFFIQKWKYIFHIWDKLIQSSGHSRNMSFKRPYAKG